MANCSYTVVELGRCPEYRKREHIYRGFPCSLTEITGNARRSTQLASHSLIAFICSPKLLNSCLRSLGADIPKSIHSIFGQSILENSILRLKFSSSLFPCPTRGFLRLTKWHLETNYTSLPMKLKCKASWH